MKSVRNALLFSFAVCGLIYLNACTRVGCMSDVECVDNYDPDAEKAGDCLGCTDPNAATYCPEADEDNGQCLYRRELFTSTPEDGWVDVWVSDSAFNDDPFHLRYSGRIEMVADGIPECFGESDTTLTVLKRPGEYYYEIETQTGLRSAGWIIYRREACRLQKVW